jgi:two-component system response regulator
MAKKFEILLVEDNPGDVLMAKEALSRREIPNNLHVTMDGEQALDFLYQRGEYTTAPRPHIILLDLNLPKKDGRAVLSTIKFDEQLCLIPVIVMTSSDAVQDIRDIYRLRANCYVTKPFNMTEYIAILKLVETFWLNIVKLPQHSKN